MKITEIILAESRGVYARSPSEPPFTAVAGNQFGAKPGDPYQFRGIQNYPKVGSFNSGEELQQVVSNVENELNQQIIWSNRMLSNSRGFGLVAFTSSNNQPVYFGKFFKDIAPNMYGKWDNNELPGLQAELTGSKKARAGFKPQDILGQKETFTSGSELIQYVSGVTTLNENVKAGLLDMSQGKLPFFVGEAPNFTAIRDNLGEVIQSLAMTHGLVGGDANKAKKLLLKNADWNKIGIHFPPGKTFGLVDFYLRAGNLSMGVSSKGDKGAAASVRNLAEGIDIALKAGKDLAKEYPEAARIIKLINSTSMKIGPLRLAVEFKLINQQQAEQVLTMIDTHQRDNPPEWTVPWVESFKANVNKDWNYGYWVMASIAAKVADIVNSDNRFSQGAIAILNSSSMMQLYTEAKADKENVSITGFRPIYPPDFKGSIILKAGKSYYASGINQKFAFDFVPE